MRRFTEAEIAEVWERRQAGELTRSIARRLGRNGSSIRRLFEDAGGVRPAPRRRTERHLTLVEREEISRGVAGGESLRVMAGRLGRAPSTISRELAGNGGRRRYRAHRADRAAWGRARRPKACKLATSPQLQKAVEDKLRDWWSVADVWPRQVRTVDSGGSRVTFDWLRFEVWLEVALVAVDSDSHKHWGGPVPSGKYLAGPVTPLLLHLEPGDRTSFRNFTDLTGYPYELLQWGRVRGVWDFYLDMFDGPQLQEVERLWGHKKVASAFDKDVTTLREVWEASRGRPRPKKLPPLTLWSDPVDLNEVSAAGHFRVAPGQWDEKTRSLVYRPQDAVSRSWFELADMWKQGRAAVQCGHCGQLFPPSRAGQGYCSGTSCYQETYQAAYNRNEYRRAYQRTYKRYKRGVISQAEWDQWRDDQENLKASKPDKESGDDGDN